MHVTKIIGKRIRTIEWTLKRLFKFKDKKNTVPPVLSTWLLRLFKKVFVVLKMYLFKLHHIAVYINQVGFVNCTNIKGALLLCSVYCTLLTDAIAQNADQYLQRLPPIEKNLLYEDRVYERYIRSVVFYPFAGRIGTSGQPPVVPLRGQPFMAILEFDDLAEDADQYDAKIIHCNHDWRPSQLKAIEYLSEYNEFNLMDFEYSINTKVPYVHYVFKIPRVKVSGNYLVIVYRRGNEKDLILTRRLVVYEDLVMVGAKVVPAVGSLEGARTQQVDFVLNYGKIRLEMPQQRVHVVLRQNYRWDNAITRLRPQFVKEHISTLEYNFFNLENTFPGGNEFRFFDFSTFGGGFGLRSVRRDPDMNKVYLGTEKSRATRVYNSQQVVQDRNGRFMIGHSESGRGSTEGDYALVFFTLEPTEKPEEEVYILGSFNDWQLEDENKLYWNAQTNMYEGTLLLKQGYYDYVFVNRNAVTGEQSEAFWEGSHSLARNEYDILVYYSPPGARGDRAIGYQAVR
jgi:hypothetical protein